MTSEKIKLEIITPQSKVYSNEVTAVRVPGLNGYFGVLLGHTPFLAALTIGEIKVQSGKDIFYFSTSGGFVEVFPHSVTILAETSESANTVDTKRAQEAKERALKRLKGGRKEWDVDRARVSLHRSINRIKVASKL